VSETVNVRTKVCQHCGKDAVVVVDKAGYEAWGAGVFVQVAFPDMDKEVREILISGTHPQCWIAMFGTEDDEED